MTRTRGRLQLPNHTHDIHIGSAEVVKRYVLYNRGEHHREWSILRLVHGYEPDLGPQPVRCDAHLVPPQIVMTRVPGRSLQGTSLTRRQQDAWGEALRRLYAIPIAKVTEAGIGPRLGDEAELLRLAREMVETAEQRTAQLPPEMREIVHTACEWMEAPPLPGPPTTRQRVLGMGDGNIANAMWDGLRCRLLDFEDAGLSDRAYETADHVEHIAARLPGRLDASRLINQVCPDRDDRARCEAFRPFFACWWLLMLLPGNRASHRNPAGALRAQADHVRRLLQGAGSETK